MGVSRAVATNRWDSGTNHTAAIALTTTSSTTVLEQSDSRIYLCVSNASSTDAVFIKLQPASTDNDAKGIRLAPGEYWTMDGMAIYTGEVSAIAESGTPTVYAVEC